jgi:cobalt-zinc-cadmium efflux system membrane fusion protein
MTKRRQFQIAGMVLALSSLILLAGSCDQEQAKTDQTSAKSAQASLFKVPADQMAHVQVYAVQPVQLHRVLRLPGTVSYNAFKTTPVISAVGGPVARILAAPGMHVKRGQPMLYVSSPDFSQLRATYLKALSAFTVADKNFARAKDLYQHHAIAEKDLLDAESARTQAEADLQSSEQALRILGVKDPQAALKSSTAPELPVLAPIEGEVVDQTVAPGQLLLPGQTQCFTISDTSTVWVMVNVYQSDLAYIHIGNQVSIQTDAYPETFSGTISYIAAALDPTSRTLQARIVTQNPGEKLKKDMYVTATVAAGTVVNALAVPDAAVLRNNENEPFVYVRAGQDQFAQRRIEIGDSVNGQTQVIAGLQPGDEVVAQGALFLQFANTLQQY